MSNIRQDCPKCGGRNTLSITTESGTEKGNCFKAGCNNSWIKDSVMTIEQIEGSAATSRRTIEDYNFIHYNSNEVAYNMVQCYDLEDTQGVVYDPARHRLVFTQGDQAVGRALDSHNKPKWYRYTDSKSPLLYGTHSSLVIVEDAISAAIVGRLVSSMALLGTEFYDEYLSYLVNYDNIFIALDKDATNKSIDIARDLCYIKDTKVTLIDKDLKEFTKDELINWLNIWRVW